MKWPRARPTQLLHRLRDIGGSISARLRRGKSTPSPRLAIDQVHSICVKLALCTASRTCAHAANTRRRVVHLQSSDAPFYTGHTATHAPRCARSLCRCTEVPARRICVPKSDEQAHPRRSLFAPSSHSIALTTCILRVFSRRDFTLAPFETLYFAFILAVNNLDFVKRFSNTVTMADWNEK